MDFISNYLSGIENIKYFIWFLFIVSAILLTYSSLKLVKNAEVIMMKTKLGGAFIGGAIISAITSLPELITATSQAAIGNPTAGLSDDLGSNAFASFLILLTAIFLYKDLFITKVKGFTRVIVVVSFFSSLLYGIFLFFAKDVTIGKIGVFAIGIIPMFFFLIYIIVTFAQYKYGDNDAVDQIDPKIMKISVKKGVIFFFVSSLFLVFSSLTLNIFANTMSNPKVYNINQNTIGGIFLAITTSLPEIVAFLYFVRKKLFIAGFGTLIGSNIFNNSLVFYSDFAYTKAPIITSQAHTNTFAISFMVSALLFFIIMIMFFPKIFRKKRYYFSITSLGVISYIVGWSLIIAF